jgi:23S rRNA (cytosine1962-C5)-methyltransferase
MTDSAAPLPAARTEQPWVRLRSAAFAAFIFKRMIGEVSPDARPGDCVAVYDKHGALFGHGLYNPRSLITLRMLNFDQTPIDRAFWRQAIDRAASLRTKVLRLNDVTDAYRLIHAEGDDLSGLVVDRYADTLSVEIFSLGIWRQIHELLPILHECAGTRQHLVRFDERSQSQEGIDASAIHSPAMPDAVNITENGVRFRVEFGAGHKTGFFCDQRDNRRRLAGLASDADLLDACCYSGGFGITAKVLGGAKDVTCVDLDEKAVEMARRNANLNQTRINAVHSDAFGYMRQMQTNGTSYDVVVLDPPKLIFGRNDLGEGRGKYFDLNRLAASLVKPGGLLLTCSCSGALGRDEFVSLAVGAARQAGRQSQILDVTGAAPDHPVSPRCPESAYLKAAWLRLL